MTVNVLMIMQNSTKLGRKDHVKPCSAKSLILVGGDLELHDILLNTKNVITRLVVEEKWNF